MATWKLSTIYKKNAVEKQFWSKDGIVIIREEGYRWGEFYCESDERPDIDLKNDDGYEVGSTEYDWELNSLDDGCWADWTFPDDMSEEEQDRIQALWDEEWYEGMETDGWSNDDTEYLFFGPLLLVNEDTGEEFSGDTVDEWDPAEELDKLVVEPEVTDWFDTNTTCPDKVGSYQVTTNDTPNWPFPSYADWDGSKWSIENVVSWRGLANDPTSN